MSVTIQFKRGNDSNVESTTLDSGEIQINTRTNEIHVHDGVTNGGVGRTDKAIFKSFNDKTLHVSNGVVVNDVNTPIRTIGFNMTAWDANDLIRYNYSGFSIVKINVNLNMTTDYTVFNDMLNAASQAKVGVIPVLFDTPADFRVMTEWASSFVNSYKDNKTIVGWEIGSAWNEVLPQQELRYNLQSVARAIRNADTQKRMIISGNTLSSKHDGSWEEFVDNIILDNPYPIDTVSVHAYPLQMSFMDPDMLLLQDLLTQLNKRCSSENKALVVGGAAKGWTDAGSDTIYTQGFSIYDRIMFALYRSGVQLSFVDEWNSVANTGNNVHPTHTNGAKHVIDMASNFNEQMRNDGYVSSHDVDSEKFETINRPTGSAVGAFTVYGESECVGTVDTSVLPKYEASLMSSPSGATIGGVCTSFWLCGDSTFDTSIDHDILVKETANSGFSIKWKASTGKIHGYIKGSGDSWEVASRPWNPKSEQWTHFVIQLDDVKCPGVRRHGGQAYVNGSLTGYTPCPANFTYTPVGPWVSGNPNHVNDGLFKIADVRVFNRTLWASEIYNLYVNGTSPARSCLARWRFNNSDRLANDNENWSGESLVEVNTVVYGNDFILNRPIIGE